jgi:hypothetical protein
MVCDEPPAAAFVVDRQVEVVSSEIAVKAGSTIPSCCGSELNFTDSVVLGYTGEGAGPT